MTERLGQFRSDLIHEGFNVLRQRRFALPLVELHQAALLAFEDMTVNAIRGGLWIARLQRGDQVEMVAVDLFQCSRGVASPASSENADQHPNSCQRSETSAIACELHDVGVKRKIRDLETFHLFRVQDGLAAGVQLFDQRGERGGDRIEVANFPRGRRACGNGARGQAFERFPNFEQFPDVVPVESDHHDSAPEDRFKQSFTDQLANRFTGWSPADTQFLGNGDVRNRFPSAQLAGRDLTLNVMIGHFAHWAGGPEYFGHGF